jgi:hypothetical protein
MGTTKRVVASILLGCFVLTSSLVLAKKFSPPTCQKISASAGSRVLYVLYCNSRLSEELFRLFQENAGVRRIQESFSGQLRVMNSCHNATWRGWRTKVTQYFNSIKRIQLKRNRSNTAENKALIMLADTDTLWSVTSVDGILEKYDCVSKDKQLVISTEVMCWVGRHCTESDIELFYSNASSPSYSSFINAGLSMGSPGALLNLLNFVLNSKHSNVPNRGLDDQRGYAMYFAAFPHLVALDYHQQLFGSAVAYALNSGVVYSCRTGTCEPVAPYDILYKSSDGTFTASKIKTKNYQQCVMKHRKLDKRFANNSKPSPYSFNCLVSNESSTRSGGVYLNTSNCFVLRRKFPFVGVNREMGRIFLSTLSSNPPIWHGNGNSKMSFSKVRVQYSQCIRQKSFIV